jgi:pyruvate dehydrogenase E2 component (dihydrolipoamide acetyltransferase)
MRNQQIKTLHTSKNILIRFRVINSMSCTLSSDHRVVDGAVAAKWTQEFKFFIENPEMMLL